MLSLTNRIAIAPFLDGLIAPLARRKILARGLNILAEYISVMFLEKPARVVSNLCHSFSQFSPFSTLA
jgi:hypothetical protein